MVIFTVGLMKDPRPLVDHIYEMWIEDYLNNMRTNRGYAPSIDMHLFKSLYTESTALPGDALHNKYINYYNHGEDEREKIPFDTTVYFPSRVYHFLQMQEGVVLKDPLPEATQIPHCAMWIWEPDEAATNTLLSTCSRIFKQQSVTDLAMYTVTCNDSTVDAPRMLNIRSVVLYNCGLPDRYLRKILRGLFGSGESLEKLELRYIDLSPFEGLLDELLEDLVSHHEARARAGLTQRKLWLELTGEEDDILSNLSDAFVEKWRACCSGISSIQCYIGDRDVDYNDDDVSEFDAEESESRPSEVKSDPGSLIDLSDSTGDKRIRSYSI